MADRIIHIVDDDAAFRDSLRMMLEAHRFRVFDYAGGRLFLDALAGRADCRDDGCALVDVNMPELDGLALQGHLKRQGIAMPVIVMTGAADVPTAVRAMKAGAVDFIEKPFEAEAVLEAIAAAHGRTAVPAADDPEVLAFRARLANLTPREREILESVVAGNPTKIIAYDLDISPRTVHVHRARIGDKLEVTGLSNLVRLALASGVSGRVSQRRA